MAMIFSEKQYSVSQRESAKLKLAIADLTGDEQRTDDWLVNAQRNALQSQISDIDAELVEYELLKSGKVPFSEASALSDLPKTLIQARIAKGYSQSDFAKLLGMKPQQIQRYEATQYMSASLAKLIEVADHLDVKISEAFGGTDQTKYGSLFSWSDIGDVEWAKFPAREMVKRNWISVPYKADVTPIIQDFFLRNAGPQFATALHRKKVQSSTLPNKYALLAWQARVLELAQTKINNFDYPCFELDDRWVRNLVALTNEEDGPSKAEKILAENGIVLVTERHLSSTHLDGAAMLSSSGVPVIALTLRYDRLDNFWFVLFHELGHVFLHLMDGLKFDFFDEETGEEPDNIEKEADWFALSSLIPNEKWDICLSRFALTEEAIKIDAQNIGIHPSIIAGRIRKESNDYMLFNNLIGQGRVRSQFEEE